MRNKIVHCIFLQEALKIVVLELVEITVLGLQLMTDFFLKAFN
jgi:hypothetical protein